MGIELNASPPKVCLGDLDRAIHAIADCRSLRTLGDALFSQANSIVGSVGMGFYLFNRANRLKLISSRLTSREFLDECDREFYRAGKVNPMLDYVVTQRQAVDGFHFYGAARWRRSGTYDLLRSGGFFHNIAGAFVVDRRVVGAFFVAATQEGEPFTSIHVGRLDLLCRAGSLALTAMRERERLRCEVLNSAADDWSDFLLVDAAAGSADVPTRDDINKRDELDGKCLIESLPNRSRAVARLLCEGQSNKSMAHQLGISVYTVQEHVQTLCRRLGAINRTDLVHRLSIGSR